MKIQQKHVFGIFVAAIMVFSTFAFVLDFATSNDTSLTYNNYEFIQTQQGYQTEINDKPILFSHHPLQTTYLNMSPAARELLANKTIIGITYNPVDPFASPLAENQYYFEQTLLILDATIVRGITHQPTLALPQLTCLNATPQFPVIELRVTNTTTIYAQGSCIIAEAIYPRELPAITTRLIYTIVGIMS